MLLDILGYLLFFAAGIGVLVLATFLANRRVKSLFDANEELTERDNMALAFRRSGLLIGIAMPVGVALGADALTIHGAFVAAREVVLVLMLMFLSLYFSDKLLVPSIHNDSEIKKGTLPIGIVEFGLFIATGMIMSASFMGYGVWYSSVVFFLLGQMLLIGLTKLYSRFVLKANGSVKDSLSVAIMEAAFLLSLGLILRAAVYGDFTGWLHDIVSFVFWALLGAAVLFFSTGPIINRLFLPTSSLETETEENNLAAMIYVGSIKIAIGLLISYIILL